MGGHREMVEHLLAGAGGIDLGREPYSTVLHEAARGNLSVGPRSRSAPNGTHAPG